MAKIGDPFIEGSEVWVPQGNVLRFHSGAYGRHSEFARVSAIKTFREGEGLPGSVWKNGRPELWQELGPHFVRREIAREAGIEAAVGVPLFRADELIAVVVLLCGRKDHTSGCIEIWDLNPAAGVMEHAAGYYGKCQRFGEISRLLQFHSGSGLPGLAWQRGIPQLVQGDGVAHDFVRASLARQWSIESGIAIPIFRRDALAHVLVLLSSRTTPIARAFEVWVPRQDKLLLDAAHYEQGARPQTQDGFVKLGDDLPGRALKSGLPVIVEPASSAPSAAGIAIPVLDASGVRAVACLLS